LPVAKKACSSGTWHAARAFRDEKTECCTFLLQLETEQHAPLRKFFMRSFRSLDASLLDMARQVGFTQCAKILQREHKNWGEFFYSKMGHVLSVKVFGQQTENLESRASSSSRTFQLVASTDDSVATYRGNKRTQRHQRPGSNGQERGTGSSQPKIQ
jgi:hypothetical protein